MNHSRQRDLILRALENNAVHPTADYLYGLLKKQEPTLSLATVYRNLNQLADNGVIRRVSGLDGATRYDHYTHNHYHFICSKCHKVYDVPDDIAGDLPQKVLQATGLTVESYDIALSGICNDCKKLN